MKTLLLFVLLSTPLSTRRTRAFGKAMTVSGATSPGNCWRLPRPLPPKNSPGVPRLESRSIGEVYMHIAIANFYLLSVTGAKEPEVKVSMEKTVTNKADVVDWLKRSLDAVATARAQLKPADFQRKV